MLDVEDRTTSPPPSQVALTLARAALCVCDKAFDAAYRALENPDLSLLSAASVMCFAQAAAVSGQLAVRLLHLADGLQRLDDIGEE